MRGSLERSLREQVAVQHRRDDAKLHRAVERRCNLNTVPLTQLIERFKCSRRICSAPNVWGVRLATMCGAGFGLRLSVARLLPEPSQLRLPSYGARKDRPTTRRVARSFPVPIF